MSEHPIIAEHLRDWREELAKMEEAAARFHKRKAREQEAYEERMAAWREERSAAYQRGDEVPPPPEPPPAEPDQAAHYLERRRQLREQRKAILACHRDEIEERAARREEELAAEARATIEKLRPLAEELAELGRAVSEARIADQGSGAPASRTRFDVAQLVEAVELGQSPVLHPAPSLTMPKAAASTRRF
ncbi:MAG: hypothetical protein ACRDXD_04730 [Acidimicrobiia bacterium]